MGDAEVRVITIYLHMEYIDHGMGLVSHWYSHLIPLDLDLKCLNEILMII